MFSFSQDSTSTRSKIFHSFGLAVFSEFAGSPVKVETAWDPNYPVYDPITGGYTTGGYVTQSAQIVGTSIVSGLYRLRVNLVEPNDNFAFAVSATPDLCFSGNIRGRGIGYFNLPILAELQFGAGATYESPANSGGMIGLGFEINKLDLIKSSTDNPTLGPLKAKDFWVGAVFSAGIRYMNKAYKLREINFKFGIGANGDSGSPRPVYIPGMTFRLSWMTFLNY